MEEKSFLPDGSPIRARLLARAPYTQDAMETIAAGARPASGGVSAAGSEPALPLPSSAHNCAWGVLYVSDSGAGFFSIPSEPTMLGFSLNAGADLPAPIHLQFPANGSTTIEIERTTRLPGKLGALLARIVASDDTVLVKWNGTDGPREIRFLITHGDLDAFECAFRARESTAS
jgi:hypothetical protein